MSLRDALLKAGKVSKAQAQGAKTEQRKKRKDKGGHRLEAAAQEAAIARDAERRAERDARNAAIVEEQRAERARQESRVRVRNLMRSWGRQPDPKGRTLWHFVRSSGRIGRITVDRRMGAELEYGAAGIVEMPDDASVVRVVAAEGIRKLNEVYPEGIRFYLGDGGPDDPLVCPPRRADSPPPGSAAFAQQHEA